MFEKLAEGWKASVAVVSSQYTHGLSIMAVGGTVDYIPALHKFGGAVIAAMGFYVMVKAVWASVKK